MTLKEIQLACATNAGSRSSSIRRHPVYRKKSSIQVHSSIKDGIEEEELSYYEYLAQFLETESSSIVPLKSVVQETNIDVLIESEDSEDSSTESEVISEPSSCHFASVVDVSLSLFNKAFSL